jgi:hypothetical protein
MRTLALVVGLMSSAALAQATETELFTDKGDIFIRAGTNAGAQVGTEVTILGDKIANTEERRRVGTGTVMEVWPTLARLALDDQARADKTAKRFVALENGRIVTGAAPAPPPPPAKKAEGKKPLAAPPTPPPPPSPLGAALNGHATFGGAGPWTLLRLWNDGDGSWSNCTLSLMPGNLVYKLARLRGHDVESVALSNFEWKGPELDITHTSVDVRCNEGRGNFFFP